MKSLKQIFTKSIFTILLFVFASTNINAQNNVKVKAEQTKDGVKITTTENGKTSSVTYNLDDAKKYLEKIGDNIEIDIEENGDNNFKINYQIANGKEETLEVNVDDLLKNIEIDLDNLDINFDQLIKEVSSIIDYEETIDEDGNKTIKIKKVAAKKD